MKPNKWETAARKAGWSDKGALNGTWWKINPAYKGESADDYEPQFLYESSAKDCCDYENGAIDT